MNVNHDPRAELDFTTLDASPELDSRNPVRIALVEQDGARHARDMYPLQYHRMPDTHEEAFLASLQDFKHPSLPEITRFFFASDDCYAICSAVTGVKIYEPMQPAQAFTLCKKLCECMDESHKHGFSWDGISPDEVRVTCSGPILPPPSAELTDKTKAEDIRSICRLLCLCTAGLEPEEISEEKLDKDFPEGLVELLLCVSEKDTAAGFVTAGQLNNAFQISQKSGGTYKRRRLLKLFTAIAMVTLLTAGSLMMIFGVWRIEGEKVSEYLGFIASGAESIEQGDFLNAALFFDSAMEKDPQRITAYYYKALAYYKNDDMDGCINYIEKEVASRDLAIYDGDEDSLSKLNFMLGAAYFSNENYESAYQNLKLAMDSGFESDTCSLLYAASAMKTERLEEASAVMSHGIFGEGGAAFIAAAEEEISGDLLAAAGKYADAAKKLEDKTLSAECMKKSASIYLSGGKYMQTTDLCRIAAVEFPTIYDSEFAMYDAAANQYMAIDSGDAKYYQKAIDGYEKAIAAGSTDNVAYVNLADCLLAVGKPDEAEQKLRTIAGDECTDGAVFAALARVLYAVENEKSAVHRNYSEIKSLCKKANEYATDDVTLDYVKKILEEIE